MSATTIAEQIATVPPLGRYNYQQYLAASRAVFDTAYIRDLHVGSVIIHDREAQEILHIEPHQDLTGRLIPNWVTITYLRADGQQEQMGFSVNAPVFVPRRPR